MDNHTEHREMVDPWPETFTPDPKTPNYQNPRYRKFVRSKACIICSHGKPVQCHHEAFGQKGVGMRGPDLWTLPLCNECHGSRHRLGFHSFWETAKYKTSDVMYEIMKLNNEFFSLNKGKKI